MRGRQALPGQVLRRIRGYAAREPLLAVLLAASAALAAVSPGYRAQLPWSLRPGLLLVFTGLLSASALLDASGLLRYTAYRLARLRAPLWLRVAALGAALGLLSSLVTNDATVVVAVPVAAMLAEEVGAPPGAAAALVTAYINYGSSLLPFGSPQNLLVWDTYRPGLAAFAATTAPLVAVGMLLLAAWSRRVLPEAMPPPPRGAPRVEPLGAAAGAAAAAAVVAGEMLGHRAAGSLAAIGLAALVLGPRGLLEELDLALVAILGLMISVFTYLGGLVGQAAPWLLHGGPLRVYASSLLLSQAISNVPATAVYIAAGAPWRPLLLGVDAAGPMLVTGSLANIIALRLSRGSVGEMHRAQLPPAAAAAAVTAALLALHGG